MEQLNHYRSIVSNPRIAKGDKEAALRIVRTLEALFGIEGREYNRHA